MSVKLSHSQIDTYAQCPRKWHLQNRERLVPVAKGSALVVGVALDAAFNDILLNHGKSDTQLFRIGLRSFNRAWKEQEDRYLGKISISKNPNILYTKKDFEEGLLTARDGEKIEEYFQSEPALYSLEKAPGEFFESGYEYFQHLREISKTFNYWDEPGKSFYNYVNWLSVKRKAPYILRAYIKELLPQIDKVVSVQTDLSTEDEEGNILQGIADFVVQLKQFPGENIIADNKSSSKSYLNESYGPGSVQNSSQLSKYKHILNYRDKMNISKGAYLVLVKELLQTKNKTCKSCGFESVGLAKTCDNKIGKKRCGGEWAVEISYETQTRLVVEEISEETERLSMEKVDETIQAIKEERFDHNWDACSFQFGHPCPFQRYCQDGDMTGLIKVEKK